MFLIKTAYINALPRVMTRVENITIRLVLKSLNWIHSQPSVIPEMNDGSNSGRYVTQRFEERYLSRVFVRGNDCWV